MTTKYRVFCKQTVYVHDNGERVRDMRPHDLRDRTKANAIELAKTLPLGNVRAKGSNRVVYSGLL